MNNTAYYGFNGPIDSHSVTRLCATLNHGVNNGAGEIYLTFSSLGGYTADGIYLYNHIRALPVPVTIHATGNIASVAVAVLAGAETRLCSQHVLFMIHPTAVPGSAEGMSWERLRTLMDSALAEEDRTDGILRDRCSIPDNILTARRFREVHFSPEDAVKFGVAHRVEEFALPHGCQMIQI
ncbi:ATP-dependent Clp protease proteolytic subunit [Bauldia litoralis]|uniref:ATP-dependent protease ClpP, protease subunit n=1 Tax=Bauldia litoralis TaxID=665467 RepID=A0A1G6CE67_9HYPH|nr:ATP-dependent Clp protease proteolytic subunit [Bauldia litoralis]SDB31190.1 ATP-dependent protease ClpP, protease subunit [Bauldia litoralis]